MTTNNVSNADELEFGKWITLKDDRIIPLEIDYFWSAFDNDLEFLKGFSGHTDVELETDAGKPADGPGAIVRFDFQGSLVRDRLLYNDCQNHVWKMDIPEATNLFTLYIVTISATKVDEEHTKVSIMVELVLQSQNLEERSQALKTLKTYLAKRIPEIIRFLQNRDGDKFKLTTLNELEIKQLAADFYDKLDRHASVEECCAFLGFSHESFIMQFPSSILKTQEEFNQWYNNAIENFFDEIHAVKELSIKTDGQQAEVNAIVHWEASNWKAPEAGSQRIIADAQHSWVVGRSPETFQPIYRKYIVHRLDFLAGSDRL